MPRSRPTRPATVAVLDKATAGTPAVAREAERTAAAVRELQRDQPIPRILGAPGQVVTVVDGMPQWADVAGTPGPAGATGATGATGAAGLSAAAGEVDVDFGGGGGATSASVSVSDTGCTATSKIVVSVFAEDTADHTAAEHIVSGITCGATERAAGAGFKVWGYSAAPITGLWRFHWERV